LDRSSGASSGSRGAAEVRTPLLANIGFDWWNAVEQRFTKV